MPRPRPASAESLYAVPSPACQFCGSTDDVERCEGRRMQCRTLTCPNHRHICEQCGVVLCARCWLSDMPAAAADGGLCGACVPEAAEVGDAQAAD